MTKFLTGALVSAAAIIASPALAIDAFTVFNGVNGNGGFYYGSYDGTNFTDFDVSATGSNCFLPNPPTATCLESSTFGPIPGVTKGGTYPTVNYSGETLAVHPLADGNRTADVFAAYQAATAGRYRVEIVLHPVGTDTTNGIGSRTFVGSSLGTRFVTANSHFTHTFEGLVNLTAGERVGTIVDANGFYGGDTTALTFNVARVPEPAMWSLMIGGFGLVGGAVRRRRTLSIAG
jgi:hypothetical protein